jgi:hypothetical protein
MVPPANAQSAAQKKQRINKAVKERAIVMSNVKILMLVQRRRTFRFNLECFNGDSKNFFLVGKREQEHGFPC